MNSFLDKINKELLIDVIKYESKYGNLEDAVKVNYLKGITLDINSFLLLEHTMEKNEGFCDPDLKNLQNYEKEINGRD
ncbi:MAG: hypothetical protein PHX09_03150 [Clostridia bacterium]|nr:hypothetical protein [Clostridia bacterium]MDD4686148.1 hypothetical protein [Clostridia bacterium]